MWYAPSPLQCTKLIIVLVALLLLGSGCETSTLAPGGYAFSGSWVEQSWDNQIQTLKRRGTLSSNDYGFIIYNDGRFVEHAVAGGCATPPVVWEKYRGTWELLAEDSLRVYSRAWFGPYVMDVKLIALHSGKLEIKRYYHPDE